MDEAPQLADGFVDVAGFFAHDHDAVVLRIVGHDDAVAIIDQAPCRCDEAHVDAVLLGQQPELLGLLDLHLPHPPGETAHERRLCDAKNQRAPGDPAAAQSRVCRDPLHSRCPSASTAPGAALRRPVTARKKMTTNGYAAAVARN